jgi:Zn-dependent M16 (insulinase) family peptidase
MSTHFLHREIREKGGAYGGGARYDPINGVFSFWSYRDPPSSLKNTLTTYDKALDWALKVDSNVSGQELDEAKLSIFKSIDAPIGASEEVRHGGV